MFQWLKKKEAPQKPVFANNTPAPAVVPEAVLPAPVINNPPAAPAIKLPAWLVRLHALHEGTLDEITAETPTEPVDEPADEIIPAPPSPPPSVAVPEQVALPVVVPPAVTPPPKNTPLEIGRIMPDGTIYAGISPDTKKPMYAAPTDARKCMSFNKAAKYARKLKVGDKKDFRIPTKGELKVLYQNRDKGALKGTFNLSGGDEEGWYWSSKTHMAHTASCQKFSNGVRSFNFRIARQSVRPVR